MDAYEKSEKIGAGTYGIVYLATHKQTQNQVALKKVKILRAQEGVSFTAYREIKSLLELHHPNVLAVSLFILFLFLFCGKSIFI